MCYLIAVGLNNPAHWQQNRPTTNVVVVTIFVLQRVIGITDDEDDGGRRDDKGTAERVPTL